MLNVFLFRDILLFRPIIEDGGHNTSGGPSLQNKSLTEAVAKSLKNDYFSQDMVQNK